MPATPAEVANDLAAQARFFVKRNDDIAKLCRDAELLIRAWVAGEVVDDLELSQCMAKLIHLEVWKEPEPGKSSQIYRSLHRALRMLEKLRAE